MNAVLSSFNARLQSLWKRDDESGAAVPVRDWVSTSAGRPTQLQGFDITLVWVVLALMAFGLLMVYSASIALPDNPRFAKYLPTHFLTRHMIAIGFALVAGLVTVQIPVDRKSTRLNSSHVD